MRLSRNCNTGRVRASSLIESVIAIAVIAICMLLATLIFNQVLSSSYNMAFQKAKYRIEMLREATKKEQLFADNTYQGPGYTIIKKVRDHESDPRLKEVRFTVQAHRKKEVFTYLIPYETR